MLPIKTTVDDIDALGAYLKGQVGWVPLERVKKTIDSKYADARKLEALKRIGLIERDGSNIKLTERGRAYASTDDESEKAALMAEALRELSLYAETVEWIHHSKVEDPSKTVVGNYWHDKHQDQLEGAQGAALTDAVIFFMRIAGEAGLGKFTRGSKARPDSYLSTDAVAIEAFVSAKRPEPHQPEHSASSTNSPRTPYEPTTETSVAESSIVKPLKNVGTSPAIHVNLEIHIAADATPETVAEIFKNMRKYVLSNPTDDSTAV